MASISTYAPGRFILTKTIGSEMQTWILSVSKVQTEVIKKVQTAGEAYTACFDLNAQLFYFKFKDRVTLVPPARVTVDGVELVRQQETDMIVLRSELGAFLAREGQEESPENVTNSIEFDEFDLQEGVDQETLDEWWPPLQPHREHIVSASSAVSAPPSAVSAPPSAVSPPPSDEESS